MTWSKLNLPNSAKNLTDSQKDIFISVANKILSDGGSEEDSIKIALSQASKINKNKENFIYSTIYEQNLWTEKTTGRKITICKKCNKQIYIDTLDDGYCPECKNELLDYHGDGMDYEALEKSCWNYMKGITEKANMATEALGLIEKIITGEKEVDITNVVKYLKKNKHHVGYGHAIFDKSIGYPVEIHNKREKINIFGQEYDKVLGWVAL